MRKKVFLGLVISVLLASCGTSSNDSTPSQPPTTKNHKPTDINLSNNKVRENVDGAIVGLLTTVDPDKDDTHTYTVSEVGATAADERFEVIKNANGKYELKLKEKQYLDFENEPTVKVNITSTDKGGESYTKPFTITVVDDPSDNILRDIKLKVSNSMVRENHPGAGIGTISIDNWSSVDPITYTVSDNRFEVAPVTKELKLKPNKALDYEQEQVVTVIVTATDSKGTSVSGVVNVQVLDDPSDNPPQATDPEISTKANPYKLTPSTTPIETKGTISGEPKDRDYFVFEAKANKNYEITVEKDGINSTLEPYMYVYEDGQFYGYASEHQGGKITYTVSSNSTKNIYVEVTSFKIAVQDFTDNNSRNTYKITVKEK